ncbi:hypothetical protein BWZ20_00590 [Winogradskyella sp. J14-2]|nr:hypothetical protein BWZ20_00335 [Winogradskyella sp. J14-2]APY06884.1 hypothetical protein BWZ20_00590 [Winogradskyella sp. J14-2]
MVLAFNGIINAQITGQLFQYESEFPMAKISIKGKNKIIESDFNGNFSIETDEELKSLDLIIDLNHSSSENSLKTLKIIIKSLKLDKKRKLNLGKIELPTFENIEITEFEKLTKSEKKECFPIYCWTELLGYINTNQLENEYLTLNCKKKIRDFNYNSKLKTVTVEWELIKDCE